MKIKVLTVDCSSESWQIHPEMWQIVSLHQIHGELEIEFL